MTHPDPPGPAERTRRVLPGLVLALLGIALILIGAGIEERRYLDAEWKEAVLLFDAEEGSAAPAAPAPPAEAPRLRHALLPAALLPLPGALRGLRDSAEGREVIEAIGLTQPERLIEIEAPGETWASFLGAGRLPVPGQPEVLAGGLTQLEQFEMDGTVFRVVGTTAPAVAPFARAYVLPPSPGAPWPLDTLDEYKTGRLVRTGFEPPADAGAPIDYAERVVTGLVPAPAATRLLSLLGMIAVAIGGSWVQVRLLASAALRPIPWVGPGLEAVRRYGRALFATHLLLYGLFFGAAIFASYYPNVQLGVAQNLRGEFQKGTLKFIGDAYASENIFLACLATWAWNYFAATIGLSVLPSLVIPAWALLKNMATFGLIGFAMSPLWAGIAEGYSFHSVTMAIELEAYILVSFASALLPVQILRAVLPSLGLTQPNPDAPGAALVQDAFRALFGLTLIAGALLLLGALYEATTLILFT